MMISFLEEKAKFYLTTLLIYYISVKPSLPYSAAQWEGVVPSFIGRLTSASRSTINLRRESTLPAEANLCIGELGNWEADADTGLANDMEFDVVVAEMVLGDAEENDELADEIDETDDVLDSTSRPAESGAETHDTDNYNRTYWLWKKKQQMLMDNFSVFEI